jgi:exopolyphosphatase/guanosine-5'-triphosphate,3'-diphosphate pyrophosphatase
VARLQQSFLKTVPPPAGALELLRRHVRGVIKAAAPRGGWPSVGRIIGSGGTIRALTRIYHEAGDGGDRFNAKDLERMVRRLAPMPPARLLRVPGMEPKRAETILAGAVLMAEAAAALDARDIRPTDYALRDGMLLEELRLHGARGGAASPGFDRQFLLDKARRLGAAFPHTLRVMEMAEDLFDRLSAVHRLAPAWRERLAAAAALHDTGESISPVHHERHAAYIALHADVPFMDAWEHEFVSQLCLWHKGGKVEADEVPFWDDAVRRGAFLKLLGILRAADALDRGHQGRLRLTGVSRAGRRVVLSLRGASDLELLRLEQKKELLEKTLRISLAVRPA